MKKSPKVAGHKFIIDERNEAYSHRSAASYTAHCECGKWRKVWADRLTVVRMEHNSHLRDVQTTPAR